MTAIPLTRETLESVVVRFAGDSGDGMQLTGTQFAWTTARAGNELATFPDYPAEIRAPTGTLYGVSAYQIQFGVGPVRTAGDVPDVLVALNPAALRVNLERLPPGGLIIADSGSFTDKNLRRAGYAANPLADGSLDGYRLLTLDVSRQVLEVARPLGLGQKEALRCKNLWVL
ncbi:MAG: 2-oxoacid:acceptor oxidoreductase family protein, partial [Candidatus Competibacterales bacterium]|nr:2-oxoacid:acceptor oxidoreductase family protein [Candidatus Competibacterales bacterium]